MPNLTRMLWVALIAILSVGLAQRFGWLSMITS
jgi:hypothetical protein